MAGVNNQSPQNGNGVEDDLENNMEITPMDNYNDEEGKMRASISWLVAKVYGANVPDQLTNLFVKNNGKISARPVVVQCLVSGELYCSAASTIFHDPSLVNQSHASVLQALNRYQIDIVVITDHNHQHQEIVTETVLRQNSPFKLSAHLAMIDGLMAAHMREVISVERVISAVKKYTNVRRNEEPADLENGILFWINKICAAVRDNLGGHSRQNNQDAPLIPEMDDLYEDICDGTCAATVVHFYHPNQFPFHDICFNDPMSIADCAHNLRLLKRFCQRNLPWNVFHFSLEDILYMHDSLKPNVNAFFADLFYFMELQQQDSSSSSQSGQQPGKMKRGLPEKLEIPNLRSSDSLVKDKTASGKVIVKGGFQQSAGSNLLRRADNTANANSSFATSCLNSTDSLATNRSADSLRYRAYTGSSTESPLCPAGVTPSSRNFTLPIGPGAAGATIQSPDQQQHYQRSDSMPASRHSGGGSGGASAAIRLQLEQKRRQYEQQRMQQGSKLAQERQQLSKEAFFTLLGKTTQQPSAASASSLLLRKKASTPTADITPSSYFGAASSADGAAGGGGTSSSSGGSNLNQLAELSKSIQEMRLEMKRLSMEQEKLQKIVEPPANSTTMIGAGQQGQIGSSPVMTTTAMYSPQHYPQHHQQQQHLNGSAGPSLSQLHHMTRSVTEQGSTGGSAGGGPGGASFKLHGDGETLSRLDPSLELTKTMTNWGMTYRVPQKPQRKTWGENSFPTNNNNGQQQQLQHQMQMINFQQQQRGGDYYQHQQEEDEYQQYQQQPQFLTPNTQRARSMPAAEVAAEHQQQMQMQMQQHQHQQQQAAMFLQLQQQQQQLQEQQRHHQQQQMLQQQQQQRSPQQPMPPLMSGAAWPSTVELVPSEPDLPGHHQAALSTTPQPAAPAAMGLTFGPFVAGLSPAGSAETGGSAGSKSSTPAPASHGHGPATTTTTGDGLDREASPGVGFVVGEDNRQKELELHKKREQIMSNAIRRREQMEQRRAQIDAEATRKREEKQQQEEMEEQRKREKEQHRQKIWQEYQRRKAEQESLDSSSAGPSAGAGAGPPPGTPQSSRTLPRPSQQTPRNHSQPPLRPKSQVMTSAKPVAATSPGIAPSGSVDNLDQLENKSISSDGGSGGAGANVAGASVVPPEPTLKLFVKPSHKTNRNLVLNAIQYCVLAGAVNEPTKQKVLTELAKSDSRHFLILFRDKKCQFKALYSWDQVSDSVHKLCGLGPSSCSESYMELMFKYDSGAKQFTHIPTRHLSAQIDGFTLKEEYWQKKKPLYSTPRS